MYLVRSESVVIGVIGLAVLLSTCASAGKRVPLYRDESGWMIVSTRDCEGLVSRAFDIANATGVSISEVAPAFSYMGFHEPEKFYGIVLRIPDGITTYWGADVTITMKYISKGDTCSVESEEFLITSEKQTFLVHSYNMVGLVPIPTSVYRIFQTGKGSPVVFVKFPLDHVPDKVIGFDVVNVRVKRR